MSIESSDETLPAFRETISKMPDNPGADLLLYARTKNDILSLAQGEGKAPTPDFIRNAATKALAEGQTFYTPVAGLPELREEISHYYSRLYDLDIAKDRIFVTSSGTNAMQTALNTIINDGDEVLAVTPIWRNLLGAVCLAQGVCREVPLTNNGHDWDLDLDALFSAVNDRTKAILIVSPSNPTGYILPDDKIQVILEFARKQKIWIVADEVYVRTVFGEERAPSFLDHAAPDDRLFVINSFSKNWAMTGWRLGWLTGPAGCADAVQRVLMHNVMGSCNFAQIGGIEALKHGDDFLFTQMKQWRRNRDYAHERISAHPKLQMHMPAATFYAFVKIENIRDCTGFCRYLIDAYGLSIAPGGAFGRGCEGYVRLCLAVSHADLETALDRLLTAVDDGNPFCS